MVRISCTALLLLGMLTAAHAEMASCERETNVEIGECLTKQLAVVEHHLTDAYRKALASRTEAKWRSLVTASQRAWISSRDQDCRVLVAYQWSGGSGEGAAVSQCLVQKDDTRVKELLAMASGG